MQFYPQPKVQGAPLLMVQPKPMQMPSALVGGVDRNLKTQQQQQTRSHQHQQHQHQQHQHHHHQQQQKQQKGAAQDSREEGAQFQWSVGQGIDTADPFPRGRYTVHGLLGSGTYGRVLKCSDNKYNQHPVAIKIVRKDNNLFHEAAKKEIKLLQNLNGLHNTIRLLRAFQFQGHICLSFELLGDNLFQYLERTGNQPLPMHTVQDIGRQVLESVQYIHHKNIIHTDLKTENILIVPSQGGTMKVKLIDFGSGLYSQDWHPPLVGTMQYRPPEMALQAGWSFPLDLWGIGCILAELYLGKQLFPLVHDDVHLVLIQKLLEAPIPFQILKAAASNLNQFNTPLLCPDGKGGCLPRLAPCRQDSNIAVQKRLRDLILDPLLYELIQALFALESMRRPAAAQALRFPFFETIYQPESTSVATTQVSELSHAETKDDLDEALEDQNSICSVEDLDDDVIFSNDGDEGIQDPREHVDHSKIVAHIEKMEAMRFVNDRTLQNTTRDSFSSVEDYDPDDDLVEAESISTPRKPKTESFHTGNLPISYVQQAEFQRSVQTRSSPFETTTPVEELRMRETIVRPATGYFSRSAERARSEDILSSANAIPINQPHASQYERAIHTAKGASDSTNFSLSSYGLNASQESFGSKSLHNSKGEETSSYTSFTLENPVLHRKADDENDGDNDRMQDFRRLMSQVEQVLGSLERLSPSRPVTSYASSLYAEHSAARVSSPKRAPELLKDPSKLSHNIPEAGFLVNSLTHTNTGHR